ncbi:MAG TPA: FtsX-like permease family protein [Bacteroidales bacterium]|nr:FtsX-like permease family protein [Bacteroidales bacterium]HPT21644.1 FtsX-like permease family protein [Bacteroidales bacterium]
MAEDFKIAWRNLWRNRRRTVITSASIFFAVFFAVIMRSYQLGSYDYMISGIIESYSGYLQVQHIKFQDDPLIDNSFSYSDSLAAAISRVDKVVSVAPHIESFALVSGGTQTKGTIVLAIDPEKEREFSNPEKKLVKYRITRESVDLIKRSGKVPANVISEIERSIGGAYSSRARLELELGLTENENELFIPEILKLCEVSNGFLAINDEGVMVSDRLAGYLKVSIGDSIILMGQGYHGASSAGIFPVRGIIKMPVPDIDNRLVIMTIPTAQRFFDSEGMITSLSVNITSRSHRIMNEVKNKINLLLTDGITVTKTWEELNPVLVQAIQGDSQSGMAMLVLLYFIIFFGIFGTVLMMVAERKREFGVLISIGMQKRKLKKIISIEMMLLGSIGLVAGLLASSPIIMYFYYSPVLLKGDLAKMMEDYGWDAMMPTAWFGPYFYWQAVVVVIMILISTIYPLRKISRLKVIEALRS